MADVANVFVTASGQDDNLGDSVLRRGLLDSLRCAGSRLHVLASRSPGYLSGLGLRDGDVLYADPQRWLTALRQDRHAALAANAGEVANHPGTYPGSTFLRAAVTVRRRGRPVLHTGVGLRRPETAPSLGFPLLRLCSLLSWRDEASRTAARRGEVAPDWAFATGSPTRSWTPSVDRDVVAVTLRFDRPEPDDAWIDTLRSLARGADVVTFAQVARDTDRARELADRLGGEFVDTVADSHAETEAAVRALLGRSRVVVSDRLHALIVGATEGAVPIGSAHDAEKIVRTMAPAQLAENCRAHRDLAASAEAFAGSSDLARDVDAARRTLDGLRGRCLALLTG